MTPDRQKKECKFAVSLFILVLPLTIGLQASPRSCQFFRGLDCRRDRSHVITAGQPRHVGRFFMTNENEDFTPSPSPPATVSPDDSSPSASLPKSDTKTLVGASRISRIFQGVSLVRNVAKNVKERSGNQTNTGATNLASWEFPTWIQEVMEQNRQGHDDDPPYLAGHFWPIRQHGRRRISRYHRKPKWMKSAAFQGLTRWAFDICDAAGDGRINEDELYAGLLLVHLNLAKYVGVTACNPLNRTEVNELFQTAAASDPLNVLDRQTIGPNAFADIVVLSCAKISSRIIVYYTLLVLLVPFLTRRIIGLCQQGWYGLDVSYHYLGRHGWWIRGHATPSAALPEGLAHHIWAVAQWLVQHLLSVMVMTIIMPWIFVKLQELAPAWMVPKKAVIARKKTDTNENVE